MALEDRIRASVEQALQGLVADIVTKASEHTAAQVADAEARMRATMDEALTAVRADHERASRDLRALVDTDATGRIERVTAEADARVQAAVAEADARVRAAVAEADARAAATAETVAASAHASEREAELAALTRLLDSVRGLDGATSLSEVLDVLAMAAGREAARAAVLVVRHDRAISWKLSGFGARDTQPKAVDMAVSESGLIGLAVSSARPVTISDGHQEASAPAFAELPADRMGLAVPVVVGGRVVAVVYADGVTPDGGDRVVPSPWPEVIEVLARHAGRCLEALTARAAGPKGGGGRPTGGAVAGASSTGAATAAGGAASAHAPASHAQTSMSDDPLATARRVARLLVAEIRLFDEAKCREGRRTRSLLAKLGPEIARARAIYDDRVPSSFRMRADIFQQELVQTLAGGDPALLGLPG
jgi:hypothetical protein